MPATLSDAAGGALLAVQAWALALGLTWRAARLCISVLARGLPGGGLLEVRVLLCEEGALDRRASADAAAAATNPPPLSLPRSSG